MLKTSKLLRLTGVMVASVVALLAFVAFGQSSNGVFAEDGNSETQTETANVIKVSPVRTFVEVSPGDSTIVKTYVTNLMDGTITIKVSENDFISLDENGRPSLILEDDKFAPTHSLKRFMEPVDNVTIAPGDTATVSVKINVPKSAQAGGYYGAIRFMPLDPDTGGQVNLSPSLAPLVLLTVPGDTVDKLNLTDFSIQQDGKVKSFFQNSDNLKATFRFENKGNIHETPFGALVVKKGNKVVKTFDFNTTTPKDAILPDSNRRWSIDLTDIGDFGHYTLEATISYGKDNKSIEVSKSFWVIPVSYMIGAGVVLIVLIAAIILAVKLSGRRKKSVSLKKEEGRLND